jgi:hypothetical protein
MSQWIKRLVVIAAAWVAIGPEASAQDVYAVSPGPWDAASTWSPATVPNSSNNVFIGSTTGASMVTVVLTQNQSASNLTLGDGSGTSGTLDLGTNTLTVSNALTIGLDGGLGAIMRITGSFTATTVNVESSNTFTFGSGDVTGTLYAYSGSNVTTAATGNITNDANVYSGSTLKLGANLNLGAGQLDVENTGSVLNLNGFNASAGNILIGQFADQPVTVERGVGGTLTAGTLYVANNTLNLVAGDVSTNLYLNTGATVTTAATGNVTGQVQVYSGSTLNLGANVNLVPGAGSIDVEGAGSVLNANGHGISAILLEVGYFDTGAASVTNAGTVSVESLYMGHGSTVSLQGGSSISSLLSVTDGSTLNVQQTGGIGLSVTDASPGVSIDSTSHMNLIFTSTTPGSWDFRWADPSSGNWISTLQGLINSGEITISAPAGYTSAVVDSGGYTYIELVASAVPEPSSIVLGCLGMAGTAAATWWRRRHPAGRRTGGRR